VFIYTVYDSGKRMSDIYQSSIRFEECIKSIRGRFVCESDERVFTRFLLSMEARGISYPQLIKYINSMKTFLESCDKPFGEVGEEELEGFLIYMSRYAVRTRKTKWYAVKKFFEYAGNSSLFKVAFKVPKLKKPKEVIERADVRAMLGEARRLRDRAFIAVLYESGCRIGEMLTLSASAVSFDAHGAVMMVEGKTGTRRVRIVEYAGLLKDYIEGRRGGGKRVFGMGYANACKVLRKAAARAGVSKRVNPHAFRHARATHLANFLTESQLKEFFGWSQGSEMAKVYVHLSGRDIDNAILEMYRKQSSFEECKRMGVG